MNILNNLHPSLRIEANESAALSEDISALNKFSCIEIPTDYLNVINEMTEVEILISDDRYFRIWGPAGCIEMNEEYKVQNYIPDSLAIGDDEGGSALILMTGEQGFGIYKVGFGNLDAEDAEFISESLENLLTKGNGIDVI
ncbi:SMI1/KNR4 family protein [Shewanella sp. VB17]|nr:SMI1/KNR4 family protein [Shewanella sp. VB17]